MCLTNTFYVFDKRMQVLCSPLISMSITLIPSSIVCQSIRDTLSSSVPLFTCHRPYYWNKHYLTIVSLSLVFLDNNNGLIKLNLKEKNSYLLQYNWIGDISRTAMISRKIKNKTHRPSTIDEHHKGTNRTDGHPNGAYFEIHDLLTTL